MRGKWIVLFAVLAIAAMPFSAAAQDAMNAVEKAVPANALVFVQIKDFTTMSKQFEETLVAKTINESEMLDAARDALIDIARFLSAYALDITYDELKEIVGKNVGIVVLESTDPRATAPVVFVVDISANKEKFQKLLNEKIKPKIASLAGEKVFGQTAVGDKTIESIQGPKGQQGYFAVIGDIFAFGTLDGVKALMVPEAPKLAESPNYKAVKSAIDVPAGVTSYLNVEALWAHYEVEWQHSPAEKAGLDALGITGVSAIGAATQFEGQGLHDKLFVCTGEQKTGLLNHFASQPPQIPKSAVLVPREYGFYARLLTGGGPKLFEAFKELLRQTEGEQAVMNIEQMSLVIQQQAMLDVEQDIIAAFGNEAFLAVDLSALMTGQKPKFTDFNFIVGMEATDAVKLQGAIAQLFYAPIFVNQGVAMDSFDHNGATIHVLSFPKAPAIRPSYAFVNGFFVFSLKSEPIQAAIDAAKAQNGLAKSDDYVAVMRKLPEASNVSAYLDTGRLARGLVAALGPKAPAKMKPFIPVLAALSEKLTGMGLTATSVDKGIMVECQSPVGGPTFVLAAASIGMLAKPADQRLLEETQKRMAKIENAIRQYKQRNGVYPASLAELTPKPLKHLPLDPFSKEGQTFQYLSTTKTAPAPAPAPAAEGQPAAAQPPQPPPGPSAYMLWSVGPDGKQDISPTEMTAEQWQAKYDANAPADLEFFKQKIWQFKREQNPDEQDRYDEGDIVKGGK